MELISGTSKVSTVVGEVNNFNQIEIICSTSSKCEGIKKGKIINEDDIALSIAKTIEKAEEEANKKPQTPSNTVTNTTKPTNPVTNNTVTNTNKPVNNTTTGTRNSQTYESDTK